MKRVCCCCPMLLDDVLQYCFIFLLFFRSFFCFYMMSRVKIVCYYILSPLIRSDPVLSFPPRSHPRKAKCFVATLHDFINVWVHKPNYIDQHELFMLLSMCSCLFFLPERILSIFCSFFWTTAPMPRGERERERARWSAIGWKKKKRRTILINIFFHIKRRYGWI